MTQQEFTERTGVKVTIQEFAVIEKMYTYSDCDMDKFCNLWCKMNKTRVIEEVNKILSKLEEQKEDAYADLSEIEKSCLLNNGLICISSLSCSVGVLTIIIKNNLNCI